jgi:hypothetical protein
MMTFLDMQDRVYAHLRDEDHVFYTTDVVKGWLNDGYAELAQRLRTSRKAEASRTLTSGTFTWPADFYEPLNVRVNSMRADEVNEEVFRSWQDNAMTPNKAMWWRGPGGLNYVYPVPDDGDVVDVEYLALPVPLDSDDDLPVGVPDPWVPRITYYALAQAFMQKDDPTSSDRWIARFETGLPPLRGWMAPPLTVVFEAGPFDGPFDTLDADDPAHL